MQYAARRLFAVFFFIKENKFSILQKVVKMLQLYEFILKQSSK